MLYLLYGSDMTKAREKLHALTESLENKKPNAALLRFTAETLDKERLPELAGGQGLFERRIIVVFDHVFQNGDLKRHVLERLSSLADSKNIFLLLEGELDKTSVRAFEKYAEKVQEFALKKTRTPAAPSFDMFKLTDALGKRDRRALWVLYQKGKMRRVSDEEMHGILFWQTKSMLLAQGAGSAQAAGLKPFVYHKAVGFAKNYSEEELRRLSSTLVRLYHDARRGGEALDTALERFILSV